MDFAQAIYGTAQQAEQTNGFANMQQGIVQGADLAIKAEELQNNRQKLAQAQQQLMDAKLSKLYDQMDKASSLSPEARNNYLKSGLLPLKKQLGLDPYISDETVLSMKFTDNAQRVATVKDKMARGVYSTAKGMSIINDPNELIKETPMNVAAVGKEDLSAAGTIKDAQQRSLEYARLRQSADQFQQAPAQAAKTEVAKAATDFNLKEGGLPEVDQKLEAMNNVYNLLKNKKVNTGTLATAIAHYTSGQTLTPAEKAAMQEMQDGFNASASAGMQVRNEVEFLNVMNRVFDQDLPNMYNMDKIKRRMQSVVAGTDARLKAFRNAGFGVEGDQQFVNDWKNRVGLKDTQFGLAQNTRGTQKPIDGGSNQQMVAGQNQPPPPAAQPRLDIHNPKQLEITRADIQRFPPEQQAKRKAALANFYGVQPEVLDHWLATPMQTAGGQ